MTDSTPDGGIFTRVNLQSVWEGVSNVVSQGISAIDAWRNRIATDLEKPDPELVLMMQRMLGHCGVRKKERDTHCPIMGKGLG